MSNFEHYYCLFAQGNQSYVNKPLSLYHPRIILLADYASHSYESLSVIPVETVLSV
jgi:hypothetical protein